MTHVREATAADFDDWLRMREDLWPGATPDEHREAMARYFAGDRREPKHVLLAGNDVGRLVGFAELSIRNIVDGCRTDRVGYLEGWYVAPDARRRGVGRRLIDAALNWARGEGCTEFGSDVEIDNTASLDAHRALGFEETGRVCRFRKDL